MNYVFFFPYKGFGGVPVLFSRMADELKSRGDANIFYVDFEGGFMNQTLKDRHHFIPYSTTEQVVIPQNSTMILQSQHPWLLPSNLVIPGATRLFFWTFHPYNLIPSLNVASFNSRLKQRAGNILFYLKKKKLASFVQFLQERNSLAFMDGASFESTKKYLGVSLKQVFLPVPVPVRNPVSHQGNGSKGETFKCLYLGRVADFKFHILVYTLKAFHSFCLKHATTSIDFEIIGSGPLLDDLKDICKSLALSNFNVFFSEPIDVEEKADRLREYNIAFCMGTAALDLASLAVPTVLLDFSYRPVTNNYLYKFIFETEDYTLGDEIQAVDSMRNNRHTVADLLESVSVKESRIGALCFQYVKQYHDIKLVADKLLSITNGKLVSYDELKHRRFTKPDFFTKLFQFIKYGRVGAKTLFQTEN
jgi:hypothetical protein